MYINFGTITLKQSLLAYQLRSNRKDKAISSSHFVDNIVESLHCLIDIKTPFLPAVVILFKLYCFRSEPRITHYCC